MTQDERWQGMWKVYMDYMETNKHCPSKYKLEDKALVNWVKHNRKLRNKGKLSDKRLELLQQLLDTATHYRRKNQYAYLNEPVETNHKLNNINEI